MKIENTLIPSIVKTEKKSFVFKDYQTKPYKHKEIWCCFLISFMLAVGAGILLVFWHS